MGNCFGSRSGSNYLINNDGDDSSLDNDSYRDSRNQCSAPIYHPNPSISVRAADLSEEDQILIAKRIGLLHFLPLIKYAPDTTDKIKECIICMCDLSSGDEVRYLPCLHTFHRTCIDDWLMRCFSCPSCLQPLEPELLGPSSGISGFGGGLIVSGVDRISSNPNSFNQPGLSPLKAIMIPSSQTSGFDSVSVDSARLTTLADEQLLIDISPYASAAVTQGSSATPPSFPPPLSSTLSLTPSQKPASHPLLSESDFSGQQAGQSDVN